MLAASEESQPIEIRDRALLMRLAAYALRAGEITALCLGDFDWARQVPLAESPNLG